MRIACGFTVALALVIAVACGGRDDSPATPAANPPQAGGAAQTAPPPAAAQAKPPAPAAAARMTAEQLEATMKNIQQTNGAVQKNVKANMLMEAATSAKQLATLFADVERFFKENNKADAVMVAQTGRNGATEVAAAAAAGDQMKAAMAATTILGTCKQCHGLYREGDATTGYRIKAGTITP